MVKALAMGASAVLIGRPVVWGLACDGRQGVEKVLDILKRELSVTMALCGCTGVGDINPRTMAAAHVAGGLVSSSVRASKL